VHSGVVQDAGIEVERLAELVGVLAAGRVVGARHGDIAEEGGQAGGRAVAVGAGVGREDEVVRELAPGVGKIG
jgi:hypothetical protein